MGTDNKQIKGFGQITRKYLGQTFDNCNCLQLLYNICIDAKVNVPDNYNGYNLNTYMKYWQDEPEQAISDMMKLFETLGEKAPAKFLKRGDIVVIKYKDSKFPSIYVGNNNIMMATREQGVIVLPLGKRFQVIMARRLI